MNFLHIETIDDLLPAITGRKDFIHVKKDGYQIIDYVFTEKDSFDDPRRLECRGIKFYPNGQIMARPLHKFFNLGEKEQHADVDFGEAHKVTQKLDGSMIHPAILNDGRLYFMTRMGITDVAKKAFSIFCNGYTYYYNFCDELLDHGITPIFEYTTPDNRIVIRYDKSALTLVAMRENMSGKYLDIDAHGAVEHWKVPRVSKPSLFPRIENLSQFLAHTSALQGEEGYVVQFSTGHALKIKADDYVLKHRAIDDLGSKKKVVEVVFADGIDDVLPILDAKDKDELVLFAKDLNDELWEHEVRIKDFLSINAQCDRKTFATERVPCFEKQWLAPAIYKGLDGKDIRVTIKKLMLGGWDRIKTKWRGQ